MKNSKLLTICAIFLLSNLSCVSKVEEPVKAVPVIVDSTPSWSENNQQNSGIIDYIKGEGWLIDSRAAARYIKLTKLYGSKEIPPVSSGEGLIPKEDGTFILPNQYIVVFATLNKKHKQ